MLNLDFVKQHLRVDGSDEDAIIGLYSSAAAATAMHFMNRRVYLDQGALDDAVVAETAGDHPIVLTDDMRAAMLLIVGHLYANREDVAAGNVVALPMGSRYLLEPHRILAGL